VHCGCRHQISQQCRFRPARSTFKAAMSGEVPQPLHIGNCDNICPFCGARSWPNETVNCCAGGNIQLPAFPEPPHDLSAIILSPHVLQNIRSYNMSLCMASVGHKSVGLPDGWFVLGGKTFHRIGGLFPAPGAEHAFAQIFLLDPEAATSRRLDIFGGRQSLLKRDILTALHVVVVQPVGATVRACSSRRYTAFSLEMHRRHHNYGNRSHDC
jgi:hypothetical protein